MEQQSKKITALAVLINLSRYLLAFVLMASGFLKAVDPLGLLYKLQDYAMSFNLEIPESWLRIFAMGLPTFEFLLGLFLLTGVYKRTTTRVTTAFMAVMTLFTLYIAVYDPVADCGCFGDAIVISNWATFFKNVVLLALAVLVWLRNRSIVTRISPKNRYLVLTLGVLYMFFLQYVALNHLPPIDFRPYKKGTDLRAEFNFSPEKLDKYAYYHTYERDGVQKEFTDDDMPTDTAWSYVGSRSELVEKGEKPKVIDFSLIDEWGEDYAKTLLDEKGYTFLMVMERLESAEEGRVDIINDLYDHCSENGIPFYAVTSSGEEAVDVWRARTGAEYGFLWADNTLLKTIVRANPALLLIKDGKIVEKCNVNDIPDIDKITDGKRPYEEHIAKNIYPYMRGWGFWIIALLLPLLLIIPLDVFMNRAKKILKDAAAIGRADDAPAADESNDAEEPGDSENNDGKTV